MNTESEVLSRCGKHPSLLFTGFCSSCLVERLSSVASVDRSPEPWCNQRKSLSFDVKKGGDDGGEVSVVADGAELPVDSSVNLSGCERKSCDVRVRKTLGSLFHLDDDERAAKNSNKIETLIANDLGFFSGVKDVRFKENRNVSEKNQVGANLDSQTQFSSSVSGIDDVKGDDCDKKVNGFEEGANLKKGSSFWLFGSVFPRRLLKWRMKNMNKKKPVQEQNSGFGEKDFESVVDFRRSCDHRVSFDSNKASWENPRHSWDGFLIGKAFTQSFTVVDEVQKANLMKPLEIYGANNLKPFGSLQTSDSFSDSPVSQKRKINLSQETRSEDSKTNTDVKDMSKISPEILDEKPISAKTVMRDPVGDTTCRKKSHGWSKAWNRSITSPLWGSNKNSENVLNRSLSESWQELRRESMKETGGFDNGASFHSKSQVGLRSTDGENSSKNPRILNNNKSIGNGDLQRLWPDRAKMKKDHNFGRSRSVHYSSPRNLDNGLLRFYLTPLRSSRRIKSKNRSKTPRSFARSILGFH